jgi:hypothetical protein
MPERYAQLGDVGAGIDETPGDLAALLALAARQRDEGLADAPWPPHYAKGADEPPRVAPSRSKRSGGRVPKMPLLTVAKAAAKQDALDGLARWKERHPEAATHLTEDDILIDAMRGRYKTWTRIRVNLRHIPENLRPPEEPPQPDYDPWK